MTLRQFAEDWLDWLSAFVGVVYDVFLQRWGMRSLPPLSQLEGRARGLTCIVTGPTSGIGRETAAELAKRGAHVVLACRNRGRGERLKAELLVEAAAAGVQQPQIEVEILDVACLESVNAFAERWDAHGRPLHALINNAGIFTLAGSQQVETGEGLEEHMATNYLGPFLLTMRMLPHLQAAGTAEHPARLVNVASKLHELGRIRTTDLHLKRRYVALQAYSNSKLAQVLFTSELQRRLGGDRRVACFSLHPGEVLTGIARSLPLVLQRLYVAIFSHILLSPSEGARCSVHCAISQAALQQHARAVGRYFDSNCEPRRPAERALRQESARWLWAWSAMTVQLPRKYDILEP